MSDTTENVDILQPKEEPEVEKENTEDVHVNEDEQEDNHGNIETQKNSPSENNDKDETKSAPASDNEIVTEEHEEKSEQIEKAKSASSANVNIHVDSTEIPEDNDVQDHSTSDKKSSPDVLSNPAVDDQEEQKHEGSDDNADKTSLKPSIDKKVKLSVSDNSKKKEGTKTPSPKKAKQDNRVSYGQRSLKDRNKPTIQQQLTGELSKMLDAKEMEKARFSASLSPEGQFAVLKCYEDLLYNTLIEKFPSSEGQLTKPEFLDDDEEGCWSEDNIDVDEDAMGVDTSDDGMSDVSTRRNVTVSQKSAGARLIQRDTSSRPKSSLTGLAKWRACSALLEVPENTKRKFEGHSVTIPIEKQQKILKRLKIAHLILDAVAEGKSITTTMTNSRPNIESYDPIKSYNVWSNNLTAEFEDRDADL